MSYSFSFYSVQHWFWLSTWPDRTVEWLTQDSVSLKTTSKMWFISHLSPSTSFILKCSTCFESEPRMWYSPSHSQTKEWNKKDGSGSGSSILPKILIAEFLLSIPLTSNSKDLEILIPGVGMLLSGTTTMVLLLDWKTKLPEWTFSAPHTTEPAD